MSLKCLKSSPFGTLSNTIVIPVNANSDVSSNTVCTESGFKAESIKSDLIQKMTNESPKIPIKNLLIFSKKSLTNDAMKLKLETIIKPSVVPLATSVKDEGKISSHKSNEVQQVPTKSAAVCEKALDEKVISNVNVLKTEHNNETQSKDCAPVSDFNNTKVVVQSLPSASFGAVSALEKCVHEVESVVIKSEKDQEFVIDEPATKTTEAIEKTESYFLKQGIQVKRNMRYKHGLFLHIRSGNGVKLSTITHVVKSLEYASPQLLSELHYILYGCYAIYKDDNSRERVKQDILHFSGYPFSKYADMYGKKRKCIERMPQKMLNNITNILLPDLSEECVSRNDMVEELLNFLLSPKSLFRSKEKRAIMDTAKYNDDYDALKEQALKGPVPVVVLEKLSHSDVEDYNQFPPSDEDESNSTPAEGVEMHNQYCRPEYIIDGRGQMLKSLPDVVTNITNARRRIINVLHILLHSRPGSEDVNRLNILEFSGFGTDRENFLSKKFTFLQKLKNKEILYICDIFSIPARGITKSRKIQRLLHFLQSPSKKTKRRKRCDSSVVAGGKGLKVSTRTRKLKDFDIIRSSVECSPAQDLTELSDLLFLQSYDSTEIHKKILEFSVLPNDEFSSAVTSRKTLLHYMNFTSLRKIARLLHIPSWESIAHPQNMSQAIMKFLMEMKLPNKLSKKQVYANNLRKCDEPQNSPRPHIMKLQIKDKESQLHSESIEQRDSGSPADAMLNPTKVADANFPTNDSSPEDSHSKYIVHRITESSYSWTDVNTKDVFTVSDGNSDESMLLSSFVNHPSDMDIQATVRDLIFAAKTDITLGDLINRVLHSFPNFNLSYRVNFIKAMALQILQEMRRS